MEIFGVTLDLDITFHWRRPAETALFLAKARHGPWAFGTKWGSLLFVPKM